MFLHQAGNRIQDARTGMCILCPSALRLVGSFDSQRNLVSRAFGHTRQLFTSCRIGRCEIVAQRAPFAADEMTCNAATISNPRKCLGRAFRCWTIFHRFKNILDGHDVTSSLALFKILTCITLSNCVTPVGRITARNMVFQLPLNIAEQR